MGLKFNHMWVVVMMIMGKEERSEGECTPRICVIVLIMKKFRDLRK